MSGEQAKQRGTNSGSVGAGLVLTVLLHVVAVLGLVGMFTIPMLAGLAFEAFFLIGLTQLVYLVPAVVIARSRGRSEIAKGLLIGGSLTFLLNGACWSTVYPRSLPKFLEAIQRVFVR